MMMANVCQVFARLFDAQHAEIVDGIENCPAYLFPINSMGAGGPLNAFSESVEWMRFESTADVEEYVRRLRYVPKTIQAYRAAMDEGVARGFTASKAMLRDVESQLSGIVAGSFSDLTAPLEAVSADILPADSPLRASAAEAIEAIRSSFQVFLVYLTDVYFPQCRDDPSCAALPNGAAMYESCLR